MPNFETGTATSGAASVFFRAETDLGGAASEEPVKRFPELAAASRPGAMFRPISRQSIIK